ncbi:MAG: sulfite exporter TauE/SafE family protein [Candidatus Eutrophobiaceae bacterium]
MPIDLSLTTAGFAVGFIVGLTGVGGGSLMTPILILFFGIKPVVAVGTDLLYAAITKAGGSYIHGRNKTIIWRTVGLMACGSIPTTALTITLLKKLTQYPTAHETLITTVLSSALLITATFLIFKKPLQDIAKHDIFSWARIIHRKYITLLTILAGCCIGALVTLSSVGAGVIGAVFLILLYPRLRPVQVVGTDLAHAIPVTAIAGLGHAHLGNINYPLLASLLLGSLPGIYFGSHLGNKLDDRLMRGILSTLLLGMGIWLLL